MCIRVYCVCVCVTMFLSSHLFHFSSQEPDIFPILPLDYASGSTAIAGYTCGTQAMLELLPLCHPSLSCIRCGCACNHLTYEWWPWRWWCGQDRLSAEAVPEKGSIDLGIWRLLETQGWRMGTVCGWKKGLLNWHPILFKWLDNLYVATLDFFFLLHFSKTYIILLLVGK